MIIILRIILNHFAADLNDVLTGHKKIVESITTTIWQTGLQNNEMSTTLNALNHDATRKIVADSSDMALKVSDQMRHVHREANTISADVYKLKMKLNSLDPQWDSQFGGAQENGEHCVQLIRFRSNMLRFTRIALP